MQYIETFMNNIDIEDILRAVDGSNGTNDENILNKLPHRLLNDVCNPDNKISRNNNISLENIMNTYKKMAQSGDTHQIPPSDARQNPSTNKVKINNPKDPVSSVESHSSDQEKQLHSKTNKDKTPSTKTKNDNAEEITGGADDDSADGAKKSTSPSLISLGGYHIPTSTLYFILIIIGIAVVIYFLYHIPTSTLYFILIIIGIAVVIYFLTSEKKKDKETKEEEKDESDPKHTQ
jgi:hypothetical protein